MTTPFVFITTHRVTADRREEVEAMTARYLDAVEAAGTRAVGHAAHVDGDELRLLQVHPDAESADQHVQLAHEWIGTGIELAPTVAIEVYGSPGPVLRQAIQANADAGAAVTVWDEPLAGFTQA
jgi:hypothetical protein